MVLFENQTRLDPAESLQNPTSISCWVFMRLRFYLEPTKILTHYRHVFMVWLEMGFTEYGCFSEEVRDLAKTNQNI